MKNLASVAESGQAPWQLELRDHHRNPRVRVVHETNPALLETYLDTVRTVTKWVYEGRMHVNGVYVTETDKVWMHRVFVELRKLPCFGEWENDDIWDLLYPIARGTYLHLNCSGPKGPLAATPGKIGLRTTHVSVDVLAAFEKRAAALGMDVGDLLDNAMIDLLRQ